MKGLFLSYQFLEHLTTSPKIKANTRQNKNGSVKLTNKKRGI